MDVVTRSRAHANLDELLTAATVTRSDGTSRIVPPRDHDPHRRAAVLAAAEAAARGDWRKVDDYVRRHQLDVDDIAAAGMVSATEIRQRLAELADQRVVAMRATA